MQRKTCKAHANFRAGIKKKIYKTEANSHLPYWEEYLMLLIFLCPELFVGHILADFLQTLEVCSAQLQKSLSGGLC